MQYVHGGDIYGYAAQYPGQDVLDFSANINPRGIPEAIRQAMLDAVEQCAQYPDPFCRALTGALAQTYGLPPEMFFCANGAAEVFYRLADVLRPQTALITAPTFSEYEAALTHFGCNVRHHRLRAQENFAVTARILDELDGVDVCILCNPNNPTGRTVDPNLMACIVAQCQKKRIRLIVDECFADFLLDEPAHTLLPQVMRCDLLVVVRAFTKMYAVPGVRLGWCATADRLLLERLHAAGQPWNVSVFAQACGVAALGLKDYAAQTAKMIALLRQELADALADCGFRVFPGEANYLLFSTAQTDLRERLLPRGILIRDCSNYIGLGAGYFRVAVKTKEENARLMRAVREVLTDGESDHGAGDSVQRREKCVGCGPVPHL